MDPALHRSERSVEARRQLAMGKALPVGESDTAALLGAQFVETSDEGAALLAGNRLRQRAGLGVGGLSVALAVVLGRLGFLLAPPVERPVARDGDHPGHGRTLLRAVIGGATPNSDVDFLQHLFRLLPVT